jgi:exonuclease SbcD
MPIRILFLAGTHLGFDLPFKPRVQRRRRGPDFFKMFDIALGPALRGEVDAVVHGGDIFYRSKVPPQLVQMAFDPLQKVAGKGVPVYLVPGNHERSAIPYRLLAAHPNIHIFHRPKTFYLEVKGATYVFRDNPDVIRAVDLPRGFAAILAGHIHRFQVLTKDPRGNPIGVPVFYPGSTERTSFVEKDEPKGYLILEIDPGARVPGGKLKNWRFHELPARPMVQLEVQAAAMTAAGLKSWLTEKLEPLPRDSVVKIRIHGNLSADSLKVVNAASLRSLTPPAMNVTITF